MATTKPRLTVTLEPRVYELLKSIADCTGGSMSAFIGEVMEQSIPVLERMAETMLKLKSLNDSRRASVLAALEEAQSDLEPVMNALVGQFDLFAGKVESGVKGGVGADAQRPRHAPTGAPDPRPVITGVNPTITGAPTAVRKPAKTQQRRASKGKTA